MPGTEPATLIPFGPFEADLHAQELRKLGVRLRLPRQSFQILKMLLEHPGELVTREEMRAALWPSDTFVDFEHGLNAAINRLREALGDDADNPRYIETLPRRGYRFIAPLAPSAPVQVTTAVAEQEKYAPPRKARQQKWWAVALGIAGLCALLAVGFYWFKSLTRQPRVLSYRQLTSDRQSKGGSCGFLSQVVTDGPRIFFSGADPLMQVSSVGGEAVKAATPLSCPSICDISPDKTELLVRQGGPDGPLWVLSLANGLARRLGNLNGHAATWSPRGDKIVYAAGSATGNDIYVVSSDAGQPRRLAHIDGGYIWSSRWSPDETVIRMTVQLRGISSNSLWQVSREGTNLHKIAVFPDEVHSITDGNWTPDGRYFLLTVALAGTIGSDIWALREKPSLLGKETNRPLQLTFGPTAFRNLAPSPDGKHVFAIGGQFRGELVRYDTSSRKLEPYLSGISADQLAFSRDGKWVAYITYPEGVLWRSRLDGTERMQLTTLPFRAGLPSWSPDGSRIAFSGLLPGGTWKIYVVPADGGNAQIVSESQNDEVDPTWAPDGNSLVFGREMVSAQPLISTADLRTGQTSVIPGSEGLFSPRFSPDGRFIAALVSNAPGTLLFDRETHKWSVLINTKTLGAGFPQWASDSKSLYLPELGDSHAPALYRIRIADHQLERLAALNIPEGITGFWSGWGGVAPDGSLLVMRDLGIQEIYALDVDLP